ncbi:hypothetical protein GLOTRDRAFT_76864 [Gloeophyllum trabeum ATCC 11539]|uniref:GST N-terminal domain-containing protein n=1 Tax=Gloeophyllum trabeum (strain ATCC 11539 / FP-39264 / Madison 617) TaxID=670483 RepID=S7Q309_GLOTA|nr:uncharacterized protein GLOTRDRAFT_76864 [Gloeophyllum trabeum ATCC 11539]EPQ54391.1 hypothetical protein GLOTRDRAFT_76864 [Gloeophyllum trabeum ATCC 11539]
MSEILLYDIPRKDPENGPWSPNTLKARLALNLKGLPFKTVWVEYPDIPSECKKIGAPPTSTEADGTPRYTLPVIYDPSTKKAIADSYAIAEYLDATYPTDRQIIPAGTEGLHAAFNKAFMDSVYFPCMFTIGPLSVSALNPPSERYFRTIRGDLLALVDSVRPEERWRKVQAAFEVVNGWYEKADNGKVLLMGDTPAWADIVVAALLVCARNLLGRESPEWKAVSEWHGGRWAKLVAALEGKVLYPGYGWTKQGGQS